jgi:hypothetical protein
MKNPPIRRRGAGSNPVSTMLSRRGLDRFHQ